MIVLSGPSASGKTEVAKLLAKKYGITRVITTTTRPTRINEIDGVDYFFVSKEKFLEMIKNDEFVEHTIYNDNYYGSTKAQVRDDKCIAIDPTGLKSYIALHNPTIVTFYLQVDEETRYQRMIDRGDSEANARARIIEDKEKFKAANVPNVDHLADTKNYNVEEVTDYIYRKYKEILASRN